MSEQAEIDWAGVRFLPLHHHDAAMMRGPGLYAFVRRQPWGERTLLYVDQAECIGQAAHPGHALWADAIQLGMNEININLRPKARIDRLILKTHLVNRLGPILNLVDGLSAPPTVEVMPQAPLSLWAGRRRA